MNRFISYNQYKKEAILNETYESYEELKQVATTLHNKYKTGELKQGQEYALKDIVNLSGNLKLIGSVIFKYAPGVGDVWWKAPIESYSEKWQTISKKTNYPKGNIVFIGLPIDRTKPPDVPSVIHELQHAYDWYRKKVKPTEPDSYQIKNYSKAEDRDKAYFRNQNEQSAFFVETINKLNFFNDSGNTRNIHELFSEFKKTYGYKGLENKTWNLLTPKIKKEFARKFSQYYYKIKEKNEINNKNTS